MENKILKKNNQKKQKNQFYSVNFGNKGVGNTQFLDYFFLFIFFIKTLHVNTFELKTMKMKLRNFNKNIFLYNEKNNKKYIFIKIFQLHFHCF